MSFRRFAFFFFSLLPGVLFLTACKSGVPTPTPLPEATLTATPAPPRQLTVCLGQEPSSLYPLNNPSLAARSILAAVYDGPIDTNSYGYQPVILERLPSLENGDAQIFSKSVYVGDEVIDASGTPVTLQVGAMIHPAGCRSEQCAIEYDGLSEISMDQMQVTFRMLPGMTWSDGEPLTAADSVYAYQVAADPSTPVSKVLVNSTQSYEAADDSTVQWWGKPGFVDPTYFINFWAPLPEHIWSEIPIEDLAGSNEAGRAPLGWGPFIIQEWLAGDHITLVKNPNYFRASQGLPRIDLLTFRFVTDPAVAISDLLVGSCDLLDPSIHLDGQVQLLRSMQTQGQLQAYFTTVPVMEQLAIGIRPADYDNGVNAQYDRPEFFSDGRVRQALAMCLDRQQVVDSVLSGLTSVPKSFLPPEHPLYDSDVPGYKFDVSAADLLLEEAGWRDVDNDPATARQSWNVAGVPAGTPFVVNYITTNAIQRQQASTILADSLAKCGIKVDIKYLDPAELYAAGPQGGLFGRKFDLAEYAMFSTGIEMPCAWFTSNEMPSAANKWVGTNISGYSNPTFDSACQASQQSLPDDPANAETYNQVQTLFAEELPVIPLYWRVKTAAARADLCQFSLDATAASNLWNIEQYSLGTDCQQ